MTHSWILAVVRARALHRGRRGSIQWSLVDIRQSDLLTAFIAHIAQRQNCPGAQALLYADLVVVGVRSSEVRIDGEDANYVCSTRIEDGLSADDSVRGRS
jgi:hypothetical protein